MRRILPLFLSFLYLASIAAAKDTLTIYTYDSFISEWGPGAKVKAAFEQSCDCTVEWVGLGDGVAVLNRLKLEGQGSKADVVLGLDTSLTAEATAAGFFQKHGVDKALARLPAPWTDDFFMPYDYAPFAVVYDTQSMKQPPTSLKELVDGDPTQKIILEDPRASTPGLGFLLWIKSVYGDKAGEAWSKLKPRILTVAPGWTAAYGLFTKGEAPMVLSYTTSPAYHMIAENTERYQAASFSEGHYAQIEVAGIAANTKHVVLARRFITFMMSPDFQDLIPTNNWMLPAGETKAPLPDAFGKLVKPSQILQFPPDEVAANRRAWIDEWLAATTR